MNKEKSRDQGGLNQDSVRSVYLIKYFPVMLLIWMKEQTLSVRESVSHKPYTNIVAFQFFIVRILTGSRGAVILKEILKTRFIPYCSVLHVEGT